MLSGTFMQLLTECRDWDRTEWIRIFARLKQLRLSRLIVQWVVSDGVNFHQSPPGTTPVLQTILELAERADMQVLVGFVHDSNYWQAIAQPLPAVSAYLADRESRTVGIASELLPVVQKYRSFGGWYMSEEIDDISWQEPAAASALGSYLYRVSGYLRLVTPAAPIAISGFANAQTRPAQLQALWKALLLAARAITVVMFQDGIGVHKLTTELLPAYLAAVRTATDSTDRTLWSVVELFEQTGGPPGDTGPFLARAAPFSRVLAQMRVASAYAAELIAFTATDYMLAEKDIAAPALSADYLAYLDR
jgi:hypothetical protein